MRVVQIIASLDNCAAGTTAWLRRLVQELQSRQVEVGIFATSTAVEEPFGFAGLTTFRPELQVLPVFRTLLGSRALQKAIAAEGRSGHVLHSSGLWRLPNIYPGWVAADTGCPLVVSPHGMLGPGALEFSAYKKWLFSGLVQRRALMSATCWHATSLKELEDIRAFGLTTPVALIPNGVDVPVNVLDTEPCALRSMDSSGQEFRRRTVLYLGRVHPKKGLDRLLAAWARIDPRSSEWELRIVGPSEIGYGEALRMQAHRLDLRHVYFHEGLYGDEKARAYREADVFVLPTRDENFGMVVAESLANGTPVICTKGAPWKELQTLGCGWWVDHGAEPLAVALSEAMSLPREVLKDMGRRGRDWMARDFSWARIASDMEALYRWCAGNGPLPPFLHFHRGGFSPAAQLGAGWARP